jgi:hypothetical protein
MRKLIVGMFGSVRGFLSWLLIIIAINVIAALAGWSALYTLLVVFVAAMFYNPNRGKQRPSKGEVRRTKVQMILGEASQMRDDGYTDAQCLVYVRNQLIENGIESQEADELCKDLAKSLGVTNVRWG